MMNNSPTTIISKQELLSNSNAIIEKRTNNILKTLFILNLTFY